MTNEEILAIFFVECEESLAAIEVGLAACEAGIHDAETVNGIFRAVHSIKGGGGAFGFAALQHFGHCLETLLSDLRDGQIEVSAPLVDLLLRALDTLADHVTAAREVGAEPDDAALLAELAAAQPGADTAGSAGSKPEPAPIQDENEGQADVDGSEFDLDDLLDAIAEELVPEAKEPAASDWHIQVRPHAGAMRNGGEPLLLLRELTDIGAFCTSCDLSGVPDLTQIDPFKGYLGWSFSAPASLAESAVRDIFDFVCEDYGLALGLDPQLPPPQVEARIAQPSAPRAGHQPDSQVGGEPVGANSAPTSAPGPSIRIDLARLDQLIDSVGELTIAQAMLAQQLGGASTGANEALTLLEGLTREIQEAAMALRAQPIGTVFSRVPRMLRELTASTGKQVKLVVAGEATELDKTVIERLGEPLTHLIRNAVDHGIEDADQRLAAGKPPEGTLWLSAEQHSSRIVIRLADDGSGIDRRRVLAKALEKDLVAPDAKLSDEEIDNLIFAPGFSTAETVSNISGRGVGMDVVRQNVKDLGGRITIQSEPGKGTAFTLTLPLTLAISDGMIVAVGDQVLVIPLANVIECLRPAAQDVQSLGVGQRMLNARGRFLPIVPVCQAVGAGYCSTSVEQGVLIVVETGAGSQAALLVDSILDQRQFVIKSLGTNCGPAGYTSGATILGDGRIALILDIERLVAGNHPMMRPSLEAA